MKALILSQNFEKYTGGYYHEDWILAFIELLDCDVYGPGYPKYSVNDTISDVFKKFDLREEDYDIIIMSSSWDKPGQLQGDGIVNIHPNINLSAIESSKKVYFLNKEYINLGAKLAYASDNGIDVIVSVMSKEWFEHRNVFISCNLVNLPFAVNLDRIVTNNVNRHIDFAFTGALHSSYLDERFLVKKEIFSSGRSFVQTFISAIATRLFPSKNWEFLSERVMLPSNIGFPRLLSFKSLINSKYRDLNIYWAERHPISKSLKGENLLPFGREYFEFLSSCSTFLCTRSADGILGPRFYELMASNTLIVCPKGDYNNLLEDKHNCLMYDNISELLHIINMVNEDAELLSSIVSHAKHQSIEHTYRARVAKLLQVIAN